MSFLFNDKDHNPNNLDWQIRQNGWASLYLNSEIFSNDIDWFDKNGFKVKSFNKIPDILSSLPPIAIVTIGMESIPQQPKP